MIFHYFTSALSWLIFSHPWFCLLLIIIAVVVVVGFLNVNVEPDSGTSTPESSSRRLSFIHEVEEKLDATGDEAVQAALSLPRRRKRDWARKVYRSLIQSESSGSSTPEEPEGRTPERRIPKLSRRHSTAHPLHLAKEIKRRTMHYFRQRSGGAQFNREALPSPPMEFYEPADLPAIPHDLTPEMFYVMHNLKMLELPAESTVDPKDIVVTQYEADQFVVTPGDEDDSMYIPLDGSLAVYIACAEGKDSKDYMVKKIHRGNAFFSLLSMLDMLMGSPSMFKTVSLKALEPTKVVRYSIRSFVDAYKQDPVLWSRTIQVACTRLLHVTMTTLHNYMGLSSELIKPRVKDPRSNTTPFSLSTDSMRRHAAGSPFTQKLRSMSLGRRQQNDFVEAKAEQKPEIAARWFAEALQVTDPASLKLIENLKIQNYEEDELILEQGSEDERLAIVLQGTVLLKQESVFDEEDPDAEEKWASSMHSKELIGGLQVLTNEPSFYTYKAKNAVSVAWLDKELVQALIEARPSVYLVIAHSVLCRLSAFVRGVDFALDWVLVDSGQSAYRFGDTSDSLFVVLSGRLRSVDKKVVIEEFGRGDVLGMIDLLQKKPRSTTVLAVRFSQLARIPEGLLNYIKLSFPQVGFRLVHLLGQYYTTSPSRRSMFSPSANTRYLDQSGADPMSHIKNLRTIAVIPAFPEIPLTSFCCELFAALSKNCRVLRLSSEKIARTLDPSVLEKPADFRLMHWLNVQEEAYSLVIYECDYSATNWSRRCLRQADAILFVGLGTKTPPKHSLLDDLKKDEKDGLRTNKELILLWPEDTRTPTNTYQWLKGSYFSGHHHIRSPKRMWQWHMAKDGTKTCSEREIIDYYEENVKFEKMDMRSDFGRLARILTGNAIGLVLGGGGARGAAHLGVIQSMQQLGIPIDMVGGTSIGSMIGGLVAETTAGSELIPRARSWFMDMTSLWRKIWDLTYAHTAMFTGAGFNRTLHDLFGERVIEDLWIPYFCISTDISTSEMRVHRTGPLWTYCRASMSLAGYLPPICDPQDGHHLLDGGYVNNLPADVMRSMGARVVIAVDVGAVEETNLHNYGDTLSGTYLLLSKFNPWAQPVRVLNMEEIQSRLAFVSCVRQLETVKKAPYCCYLRPPIETFKTLDFGRFEMIMETGERYGEKVLVDLLRENEALRKAMGTEECTRRLARQQSGIDKDRIDRCMSTSFTDLAAALSKVPSFHRRRNSLSALDQIDPLEMEEILEELINNDDSHSDIFIVSEDADGEELHDELVETH
ncbi:unnamed protein product, partial [Mesorhabditis spiculigera]